ncbi:MAG: methyltransferase domain-containing protein [Rhodospirillales bacterium]|nr:methyltransferase domain-containing protein [Rhodospirillales bacterium]
MSTPPATGRITDHYAAGARLDAVLNAVRAAIPPGRACDISDLAPLDQFHAGGAEATDELARLAGVRAGMRVLDVGCGIGGPARHLAARFACQVTGLDLAAEYCRIAEALTTLVGLDGRAAFQAGDACNLRFPAGGFDLVWTQHAAMNIADRPRLYAEMHRVLAPGGVVAIYDAVAGDGDAPLFPTPWADRPEDSFLLAPAAMRTLLEAAGFEITVWQDATEAARGWFARRRPAAPAAPSAPPPALGLHLLLGPDTARMVGNFARNVLEGRVGLHMAVARKPG